MKVTGGVESSGGRELGRRLNAWIFSQVCYRESARIRQIITVGSAAFVFKRYFYAMF